MVEKGWKRVVMGDVIREETKRRGLPPDAKNTGEVMKQLRAERGEAAVAELCMEVIEKTPSEKTVVDGVRSVPEVEVFRRRGPVLLVAVDASPKRRFELLRERRRSDDPLTYDMFRARDERELAVGVGKAIALADETVSNEHGSQKRLAADLAKVVEEWLKEDGH